MKFFRRQRDPREIILCELCAVAHNVDTSAPRQWKEKPGEDYCSLCDRIYPQDAADSDRTEFAQWYNATQSIHPMENK